MIYNKLQIDELIDDFNNNKILTICANKESLEKERYSFICDYSKDKIKNMKIEEYVSGIKKSHFKYDWKTFCYRIETKLRGLGSINGSTALKFGVYYNSKTLEYEYAKKYGNSKEEVFDNIKEEICKIIDAGVNDDFASINNSKLSHMFKCKILATYYPEKYIGIFNKEHIIDFLNRLGVVYENEPGAIEKSKLLLNVKKNHPTMKNWSNYQYMMFLYECIGSDFQELEVYKATQKERDNQYPSVNKKCFSIKKKEWIDMLGNEDIFKKSDINLLKEIYICDNHATTCYDLALKSGRHPSSFNKPIVELAKRIVNYTKIELQPSNDIGKYWPVLFWGRYLSNKRFEWKIKPSLANALITVFPLFKANKINEFLDFELEKDFKRTKIDVNRTFSYSEDIKDKQNAIVIKGVKAYPRNRQVSINALGIADFKCEVSSEHKTFIRKSDGTNYTEPHHLIPIAYQDNFEVSLDIEENIISLCSNCHNEIHYGKEASKLIEHFFEKRKEMLHKKGIKISLNKLLTFYK